MPTKPPAQRGIFLVEPHIGRADRVRVTVRSGHRDCSATDVVVGRVIGLAQRIAGTSGCSRAIDVVFRQDDPTRPQGFAALHTTFAASRVISVDEA